MKKLWIGKKFPSFHIKSDLKMKLTTFVLLVSLFQLHANDTLGQKNKISLNLQNVSVEKVIIEIESLTDFKFLYNDREVDYNKVVSIIANKEPLISILGRLFADSNINFEFIDQQIILTAIGNSIESDKEQQNQIRGTIRDPEGNPLLGATVVIKNSNYGVPTDSDGNYTIRANRGDILVFSSLGYSSQEVEVADENVINIVLKPSTDSLDEVTVVSTGYQEISRERATGSYEKIDEETLDKKTSQDIISQIEGEIPGIVFDNIHGPTVRGVSTIHANNDPLIVVDGFPVSQDFNTINPKDVESITVLKDAAAASIWGIRAANGVIVITTKKGNRNQTPTIEFSTSLGITPKIDLADFRYVDSETYLEFERLKVENGWIQPPNPVSNSGAISEGLETYLALQQGDITQGEANTILNRLRGIRSADQFSDLFLQDEFWNRYNLSARGGNENNAYRMSIAYNKNDALGSFKNNDKDELIANISNTFYLSPKFTFTGNVNYVYGSQTPNGISITNYSGLFPYQQIIDNEGNYITQPFGLYQPYKEDIVSQGYPYDWDYNLKREFDNFDRKTNSSQIRLQALLKYDITDHLNVEGRYQFENEAFKTSNLFNEETYTVRSSVNGFTNPTTLEQAIPKGSQLQLVEQTGQSHSGRFQLNYDQLLAMVHRVTAIGGYEIRQELYDEHSVYRYGYNPAALTYATIDYVNRYRTSPSGRMSRIEDRGSIESIENRFISYYANASYGFDSRYILSVSTRLDDTNLFGADEKYKNIPLYSVGGKWNIHNESFFNSELINLLSLRATYGSNGNVDNSTSPFVQAGLARDFDTNHDYAFISNVKNPTLRLEKTFVTNLGIDYGLWNNRLSGSLEYYKRRSIDLLSNVSFPSIYGFNSALINAGELENKGLDLEVTGQIIKGDKFNFTSTLNFSYNKNMVTKVDVPESTPATYILSGTPLLDTPLNYLYSYNFAGLDSNGDPQFLNENGELVNVEGDVTDDQGNITSTGIESIDALVYNGTLSPKYYGGWINNISYGNFFLRTLATFKFGHVFRNTNITDYTNIVRTSVATGSNSNIYNDFYDRWQNAGDENITDVPRMPTTNVDAQEIGYYYYKYGHQLVDNASHIRLRQLILGYNFEPEMIRSIGLKNLNISVQGDNLAIFNFNKWDLDPEYLDLPLRPTYTFSLTANF